MRSRQRLDVSTRNISTGQIATRRQRLGRIKAVADVDDSRRANAELAVAREQLRLADDLHDMLGHALEAVAFKSELATRLLEADPGRARTEMEEVQRVARESMYKVGVLMRGASSSDLAMELAGARIVLESAGVVLVVHGDAAAIGPAARSVLGRVLQGALTNLLGHAQARHCTIEMDMTDGYAHLQVVDDGASAPDTAEASARLDALRQYLDEHSGRLDVGPGPDGTFRLDAVLPGAAR